MKNLQKNKKKCLTNLFKNAIITMWKAKSNTFLEYLAREQVTTKKLKKVIDKLSTICYNYNVNKNNIKRKKRGMNYGKQKND